MKPGLRVARVRRVKAWNLRIDSFDDLKGSVLCFRLIAESFTETNTVRISFRDVDAVETVPDEDRNYELDTPYPNRVFG